MNIVGKLEAISSSLQKYIDCMGLQMITSAQLQKTVLLGITLILQQFLCDS